VLGIDAKEVDEQRIDMLEVKPPRLDHDPH
jgi:hypothetical protein